MPSKVPEVIECDPTTFAWELGPIAETLERPETEDSWDAIGRAIQRLTALVRGGAPSSDVVAALRAHSKPLIRSLNSERTTLSGYGVTLLEHVISTLQNEAEPLCGIYIPPLLGLCTRTGKLYVTRARGCLMSLALEVQPPTLLTHLNSSVANKAVTLRLVAVEVAEACLQHYNPRDLAKEARAKEIETIIKTTAKDANPDVRKASRKLFEAYRAVLSERVSDFVAPLSPVSRKYLDIKSTDSRPPSRSNSRAASVMSMHSARIEPAGPSRTNQMSSSGSASQLSSSGPARAPSRAAVRSPPLVVAPPLSRSMSAQAAPARRVADAKAPGSMAPPDHVPARRVVSGTVVPDSTATERPVFKPSRVVGVGGGGGDATKETSTTRPATAVMPGRAGPAISPLGGSSRSTTVPQSAVAAPRRVTPEEQAARQRTASATGSSTVALVATTRPPTRTAATAPGRITPSSDKPTNASTTDTSSAPSSAADGPAPTAAAISRRTPAAAVSSVPSASSETTTKTGAPAKAPARPGAIARAVTAPAAPAPAAPKKPVAPGPRDLSKPTLAQLARSKAAAAEKTEKAKQPSVVAKEPAAGAKQLTAGAKAAIVGAKAPTVGAKAPSAGAKAPTAGAKAPTASAKPPAASAKPPTANAKALAAGAKAPARPGWGRGALPPPTIGGKRAHPGTGLPVAKRPAGRGAVRPEAVPLPPSPDARKTAVLPPDLEPTAEDPVRETADAPAEEDALLESVEEDDGLQGPEDNALPAEHQEQALDEEEQEPGSHQESQAEEEGEVISEVAPPVDTEEGADSHVHVGSPPREAESDMSLDSASPADVETSLETTTELAEDESVPSGPSDTSSTETTAGPSSTLYLGDTLETHSAAPTSVPVQEDGESTPMPAAATARPRAAVPETPISNLLSSIQQGFLATPCSPLSPPQGYADRAAAGGLPLSALFAAAAAEADTEEDAPDAPVIFGVKGLLLPPRSDAERAVLGEKQI